MAPMSQLDPGQIAKSVFDSTNDAIQVHVVANSGGAASTVEVTNAGGAAAVNIQDGGNSITVDSTDLDIRDLSEASDSVAVYGNDGTSNVILKTDAAGELQIDVLSSALPTGAATEATLAALDAKVTAVDTDNVTVVNGAGAAAINIQDGGNSITVDASDLDVRDLTNASDNILAYGNDGAVNRALKTDANGELQIDVLSSALPTGAATEATLASIDGKITAVDTDNVTIVNAAGASAVNIQDGGNSITVDATNLDIRDLTSASDSVAAVQSGSWSVSTVDNGFANSEFVRNAYASTNVTTGAYVELIASTGNAYKEIEIFDSSGETLLLAFGAAASESDQFLIFPGGNGRIKKSVPAATRISIKAVSATASVGEICINLYG